ncbi:hypothetical protein GO986_10935 [Deinococcus sp. HMF7620]|uniref:Uncharacterized protein n=1 Tax=Deinococcus arboris TaxID=2682977 RepID=A0A7C9IBB3_9DEIO|nr:hypothetical protein [Deinococcus arboris]MVN87286.1 hypothetical protein [Deinococcus arboris]
MNTGRLRSQCGVPNSSQPVRLDQAAVVSTPAQLDTRLADHGWTTA